MKNTIHKVLVDTDVVIDFITKREPFAQEAAQLFNLADKNQVELYVSSLCLRKIVGHKKTIATLQQLVEIVEVLSVDKHVVKNALNSKFSDFEDALQHFTAVENRDADIIITRNLKDYKHSNIPVMTAGSFIELLIRH